MKLLYVAVFRNETQESCLELAVETDLGLNRFIAAGVIPLIRIPATALAVATKPETRHTLVGKENENDPTSKPKYMFYSLGHSAGICGIVGTDLEYPAHVAQSLAGKIVNDFASKYPRTAYANLGKGQTLPMPELKDYIQKYQDPAKADSITQIQKELADTKEVMHQTIQSVLQRGETLQDLVAKSDTLSASSKMFYTQAKKQNSCCNVM